MNLNLLPKEAIEGKTGFYPVCSAKEWEELPYVEWTDGLYKPCHYWGMEYFIHLEKR